MNNKNNDSNKQANNPLHGVKLADILEKLVTEYGMEELGMRISIRCFNYDPSVGLSYKFLRKTPWARGRVEELYINPHYSSNLLNMNANAGYPQPS
ncbi:MAG TPA: VF530 family protein [Perlabentimonas sp.]|jgi:uncharacterized protein (DUF2132 family)|nr:VF530 family protein [Bacteroidales bacterium]MDD4673666.1 VF530 family protein [Bacteroidales bacterium]MDY0349069.1 VF530 family protein [Tenuifilaceae bacterium]HZJ74109.1 VF530 family protein [Perlabentimonas sp.]